MLRQFLLGLDESVDSALRQLQQQLIITCVFYFTVMVQRGMNVIYSNRMMQLKL